MYLTVRFICDVPRLSPYNTHELLPLSDAAEAKVQEGDGPRFARSARDQG